MNDLLKKLESRASPDRGIDESLALEFCRLDPRDLPLVFPVTGKLTRALSGRRVYLCSIINAKSGRCTEDCRFCAQSSRYRTGIESYPLVSPDRMLSAAKEAVSNRAREFSIVASGKGVTAAEEVEQVGRAIEGIVEMGMGACVSPGIVSRETLDGWKHSGLGKFHHNLESAPSFFKQVCTTHSIDEDVAVVRDAKAAGLEVCCGGIFGMGESWEQRVELALLLRDLEVDTVPINFLNPIPGTPMAGTAPGISPLDALKTIALFRLVLPSRRIVVCGGREVNLRDLQAFMFEAGANGMMIGNYLTTVGRPPEEDLRMIEDLGLEPAPP